MGLKYLSSVIYFDGSLYDTIIHMFVLFVAYATAQAIYRIWFHPLAKFPGPLHMSVLAFPALYAGYVKGVWIKDVAALHRNYGPAMRIGPNHLALDGCIGWPEVFHRSGGKAEYEKMPPIFSDSRQSLFDAGPQVHRRQRRQLVPAFSDSALADQEPVIGKSVDLLVDRLADRAQKGHTINIFEWMNFTTFNILGNLAFSKIFSCLKNNGYHPWVLSIFRSIRGIAALRFFHHYPAIAWFVNALASSFGLKMTSQIKWLNEVRNHAQEKAKARMAYGPEPIHGHTDLVSYMMGNTRNGDSSMTEAEILANSPNIVVAGSETSATALSGFFFHILRNLGAYAILTEEIRTAFRHETEINLRRMAALGYLQACINEALRVYPPVAETPTRISPGDTIDGKYVPAGVPMLPFINTPPFAILTIFLNLTRTHQSAGCQRLTREHQERFSTDRRAVFKPFSQGARDCIGRNLAYSEIRIIICRLLYRFDFEFAYKQDAWQDSQMAFVLWDKGPLYLNLRDRK